MKPLEDKIYHNKNFARAFQILFIVFFALTPVSSLITIFVTAFVATGATSDKAAEIISFGSTLALVIGLFFFVMGICSLILFLSYRTQVKLLIYQSDSMTKENSISKEVIHDDGTTVRYCPNCGKVISPDSKFCNYCGCKILAPVEQGQLVQELTGKGNWSFGMLFSEIWFRYTPFLIMNFCFFIGDIVGIILCAVNKSSWLTLWLVLTVLVAFILCLFLFYIPIKRKREIQQSETSNDAIIFYEDRVVMNTTANFEKMTGKKILVVFYSEMYKARETKDTFLYQALCGSLTVSLMFSKKSDMSETTKKFLKDKVTEINLKRKNLLKKKKIDS